MEGPAMQELESARRLPGERECSTRIGGCWIDLFLRDLGSCGLSSRAGLIRCMPVIYLGTLGLAVS